ncbi:MAG: peptide chain release factor 2 [Patescibacteria group bacterium]
MLTNEEIENVKTRAKEVVSLLKTEQLDLERVELEGKLADPTIWNDTELAQNLSQRLSRINQRFEIKEKIKDYLENLVISHELSDEESEADYINRLNNIFENQENESLFSGEFDNEDCFLSIQSGAGGVDAQDWAAMLMAMYQTYSKNQGFDYSTINLSLNPEGGVKSCMLEIRGEHAFGLFKEEAGVHRLIRISPFNSGGTRETSFALVEVLPSSIENSTVQVELNEKDLKWEVSTSQGAGGQSVNTTYSAVKLTHIPSGLTVSCQNERSQIQNRAQALKILKSRLLSLEIQKQKELKDELRGDFKSPEWGSQIRTYTLHPYKLVKDHRSNWESSDPLKILEQGDLTPIILSVKKSKINHQS